MELQNAKGLRLLLAGALLLAPSLASAQKSDNAASAGKKQATAASSQANRGGMGEGIKVHGSWVIDVRNPDGTLAVRREIQNALGQLGAQQLAALLTRNSTAGRWTIDLIGGPSPCGPAQFATCQITEAGAPAGTNVFPTLTVSLGGAANQVVLTGMATANQNGEISIVVSHLSMCPNTTAPSACQSFALLNGEFSRKLLGGGGGAPPAVSVVAGQIIQITVTFSFS